MAQRHTLETAMLVRTGDMLTIDPEFGGYPAIPSPVECQGVNYGQSSQTTITIEVYDKSGSLRTLDAAWFMCDDQGESDDGDDDDV